MTRAAHPSCLSIDGRIREADTIVDVLLARADADERGGFSFLPDGEAVGESLSWRALAERVAAASATLRRAASEGDRALLFFRPGLEFLAAFLGCLHAGVVAVPCVPPLRPFKRSFERIDRIVRDASPAVVLAGPRALPPAGELDGRALPPVIASDALFAAGAAAPSRARSDGVAFLQYTSGSTSAPRGVVVTHANLMHNLGYIHECAEHRPSSISVIWVPQFHDMGLIDGLLAPIFGGFRCFAMPPHAFVQKPARWLRAISRHGGTHGGGPNFAYELCLEKISPAEAATMNLSTWRAAHNGAEPIRPSTLEAFAERFAVAGFRLGHFHPCYGLAEATLKVSGGAADALRTRFVDGAALERGEVVEVPPVAERARAIASSGRPFRDFRVAIVDEEARAELRAGTVGEIWLAGPSVAAGYYGDAQATEDVFGARLQPQGEGPFLRTGDLGFVVDGELYVVGRSKDLVIVGGRNLYPQDVERTVESAAPSLAVGCAVAFSVDDGRAERLVVLFEHGHSAGSRDDVARRAELVEAVARAIARDHLVEPSVVAAVPRATLLRTSSGKIRRAACRQAWQSGALELLHARAGAETAASSREPFNRSETTS